jgi:hypothetical protein
MRTTVGRFWGYVSVLVALSVSLAGNVTAAFLKERPTPSLPFPYVDRAVQMAADPTWVDIGIAGLPPLAAFLVIELANHNPWAGTKWGPTVLKVLLIVVAPASAVVSFIHLVSVVMHDKVADTTPEGLLNWSTAVLTALLIDGLMFGGTAALLLPKSPTTKPSRSKPVPQDDPTPHPEPEQPKKKPRVVRATLAPQKASTDRKRWPAREHPCWPDYVDARGRGVTPNPQEWALLVSARTEKDMDAPAARTMLGRWSKEYEKA